MYIGMAIIAVSLVYMLLVLIVYFSKNRINNIETNIYGRMLIINAVGLILELFCCYYVINRDVSEIYYFLNIFFNKVFLVYLFTWLFFFTMYIFFISFNQTNIVEETIKKNKGKIFLVVSVIYLIIIVLINFLPLYYFNDQYYVYSYGPATDIVMVIGGICILFDIFCVIKNFRNIKNKKYSPLIVLIFLMIAALIIRNVNPGLIVINSMFAIITILMYFTIENPDVNLLRAIANKKDEANRINNDKAMFLFNMSQDIKKPVMDIQVKCENALMGETIDEFKDGIRSIKESANQASRLINASLNISEASSANLKLVNKKYNTALLFKEIVEMTKTKLKDKEVEFRYNIDDSIPEYLMGDSIRFKQMVAIILNNAIKHTEKGYIELDVSYVIKVDICSFIINVIDTGKGMSQEKLNEALNSSKEVTGSDEDIATSKTLAGLSNGTIMGVSEEGKGSKFTIIVNQKIAPEEENSSIERSVLKVDSDKKILVVENDEKEQNKIIKLLKDENISIEITNMGVGCLEKIRNGSHYDLIIINEELPKLSGIMTYQKLKIINNFNTPVIMMIDKSHEEYIEKYLDLGIKKCLIKQEKKTTKDNILEVLRKN